MGGVRHPLIEELRKGSRRCREAHSSLLLGDEQQTLDSCLYTGGDTETEGVCVCVYTCVCVHVCVYTCV